MDSLIAQLDPVIPLDILYYATQFLGRTIVKYAEPYFQLIKITLYLKGKVRN